MTKAATKQQRASANANAKIETQTTNAPQSISSDIFLIETDIFSAGRSGVQANTNTNTNALGGVKVSSLQRARQLRKDDSELYKKVQDFFVKNDVEAARAITSKSSAKREQVDSCVRGAVSAKAIACLTAGKESQPALFALLLVSSALTKYGERELVQKFKPSVGVLHKSLQQQTKQQQKHFQVETRKTAPFGPKTAPQSIKQQNAQHTKQQNTQQPAGKKAGHSAQLQKAVPQAPSKAQMTQAQVQTPPPAPVTAKSSKTVTKTQSQSQSQKESPTKNVQHQTAPVKSAPQTKNASPAKGAQQQVKNLSPLKNVAAAWAGPLPATVLQNGPTAIISSAPDRASITHAYRA